MLFKKNILLLEYSGVGGDFDYLQTVRLYAHGQ